jgi:uncharacterized repeat protein (TIGR01451 family)
MDRRRVVLVGLALALLGSGHRRALAQTPAATGSELPPAREANPAPTPAPAPAPVPALPPAPPVEPAPKVPDTLPPPPALPPPGESPAPPPRPAPTVPGAPRDDQVERAQGALPAASQGAPIDPGVLPAAADPASPAGGGAADPFVLPKEKLPLGRQSVALSVDVVGPQVLNINQITALKIVVRNTGTTDAMGVVVRDELPEGLDYLSSQPEAQRDGALLFWKLSTVPAGSEKVLNVRVKPVKVGPFDHAATVTLVAGSKSRTIVREPKLKVEQTATSGKVLKGQQVQFRITISNPGDGPARNIVVQAKLSAGLRHESGEPNDQNVFEQTLDQIEPGGRVVLDVLVADTKSAGEQSCEVIAQSNDVTTNRTDARSVATVTVIEPLLKVAIAGDEKRYTDTVATYSITVQNPGTATAHNVYVLATLPLSGRLVSPPPTGARWDASSGKLIWRIPQVEPGEKEKMTLSFQVRMGGVGIYPVTVNARADGGLSSESICRTEVLGLADFDLKVQEQRRVVDVGDSTMFTIRIKNIGTKDGSNLLVSAVLAGVEPVETKNGTDDRTQAQYNAAQHLLVFPPIERLGPGKEIVLGIKVKVTGKGLGKCQVYVMHDDLAAQDERLEDMASFRITARRQSPPP